MITVRRKADLDNSRLDWLDAHHHFVVTKDGNKAHTPVGPLIVWNDDTISAGCGFPTHGHKDLEIVTYVIDGAMEHWDDAGNVGRLEAGDVQVMSAGAGIRHEERAHLASPTRLFQLWLLPRHRGEASAWQIKPFPKSSRSDALTLLASGYGEAEAVPIDADARVMAATIAAGQTIAHSSAPSRRAYLVIATGSVEFDGVVLRAGDAAPLITRTISRSPPRKHEAAYGRVT